jgi:roadblock/LC7 domain-containing protein
LCVKFQKQVNAVAKKYTQQSLDTYVPLTGWVLAMKKTENMTKKRFAIIVIESFSLYISSDIMNYDKFYDRI